MRRLFLVSVFPILVVACSNSEPYAIIESELNLADTSLIENAASEPLFKEYSNYIPFDDSTYPYVGLPRIVIETEGSQKIQDKETEIPARLQVWGEDSTDTDILNLTIKGRGNTTWTYPKKPYTIQFEKKTSFLGMPAAKKWILLANYRDRTLMRNSIAFELAHKTSLAWTPSGKFAEVFLNGKYIGCYFVCEKIEVKKNRLELSSKSYLLEFDTHYDADYKFRTSINDLPVNIKYPKEIDDSSFSFIQNYIDSIETVLQQNATSLEYLEYINQESFADYLIVYAMANNSEPMMPKSVFMHKDGEGKLNAGPVWDFDYATFNIEKNGISNRNSAIFKKLISKKAFKIVLKENWESYKPDFEGIFSFIDSLADYTSAANNRNVERWPVNLKQDHVGDEDKSFEEAIDMLKKDLRKRIDELDTLIRKL